MKTLKIEVTAEDIAGATSAPNEEPQNCPISRAVRRIFPSQKVGVGYIAVVTFAGPFAPKRIFLLPPHAGEFAAAFDRDEPVSPFTFYARPE
jgi:hypothetical protein